MGTDDCPLRTVTSKDANSAQQQIMPANAVPASSVPCNVAAAPLCQHRPINVGPVESSLWAKVIQNNSIRHPTAVERMQLDSNANSAASHVSCRAMVDQQQPPAIISKMGAEEPSDSGNETSSLSPGHTPMNVSPTHSLPSRSNSFSVSNILRVQAMATQHLRCDQNDLSFSSANSQMPQRPNNGGNHSVELEHQSAETVKGPAEVQKNVVQNTDQLRVQTAQLALHNGTPKGQAETPRPFESAAQMRQLHSVPFGIRSANAPMLSHAHSAFRQPICSFPPSFHHQLHASAGHALLGNVQLPFHQSPAGVVFAGRSATPSPSGTNIFALPPSATQMPSVHGIHPLLLSNPAVLFSLLHQQQQQHQQNECCVVCGDRASGHHYGVQSCEGCKGFFRRSIQSGMRYECAKNDQCEINRSTRNRCQKCRLERCFIAGMQQTHVRLEKNRKRKSESEQRELSLEGTRQSVELVDTVVLAFKSSFLTPATENSGKYAAQLAVIAELSAARHRCRLFVEAIPDLTESNKDILLDNNKVSAVMCVLAVLLNADDNQHHHKAFELYDGVRLARVRQFFDGITLHWEEIAVFISLIITFDSAGRAEQRLFNRLCSGLFYKISERTAEDGENVNPSNPKTETLGLYTKLISSISEIFK